MAFGEPQRFWPFINKSVEFATLVPAFATRQDLPAEQFADRLLEAVLGWPENGSTRAQADDITVVVIDIGNMPEQTP